MNNEHTHQPSPARNCWADALHRAHTGRITTAEADLEATEDIDLSTAGRATLALTIERLRGALAELIRSEREHHPDS